MQSYYTLLIIITCLSHWPLIVFGKNINAWFWENNLFPNVMVSLFISGLNSFYFIELALVIIYIKVSDFGKIKIKFS